MITLYFAPLTRSIRIMWLLEELGLDYRIEHRDFASDGTHGGVQATPTGQFPVIEDDGQVVSESGAIVQYLIERYGNGALAPAIGTEARASYLTWFHIAEATLAGPINNYVWLSVYRSDAAAHAGIIEDFRASALRQLDRIEGALGRSDYLADDRFTAADVMIGFSLWSAKMLRLLTDRHPRTFAYLARLAARPGFAKALAASRRGTAIPDRPTT